MPTCFMVKDRNLSVLGYVLRGIKTRIKKRGKITDFFKNTTIKNHIREDDVTRSHEHFTST